MELPADTQLILCLPDEHLASINELLEAEENKSNGFIHLTDKHNTPHKFYKVNGNLYADRSDNGKILKQPVISMTEANKIKEQQRPFKDKITERIQADFPDKTNDEVEQDADILNEANESIKKLIASGLAPSVARSIIMSVLECQTPPSTIEELATFIGEREKIETQEPELPAVLQG